MQKTSHAIFNRIHVRLGLVAALVGGVPLVSHAAYATLTPPPGWSAAGSAAWATPSNSFAASTANQWINNAAKSSAMLNAGGKQIAINASMKLGPTAGKVAMAFVFNHPAVRIGMGISTILSAATLFYDLSDNKWKATQEGSINDPKPYYYKHGFNNSQFSTEASACNAALQYYRQNNSSVTHTTLVDGICTFFVGQSGVYETNITKVVKSCPPGWTEIPGGLCKIKNAQIVEIKTEKEFLDRILNPDDQPGWPTVPNELPLGTPLPVELPVINPDTGVNPFPKPLFVPTGQPVPNPQYNPDAATGPGNQPWKQPGTTITPRPTPGNPWQVDIQPTDREQGGPDPFPDTEHNPDSNPETDKPKPEEQQSLCEKHPEILACAKPELDTPDGEIPKSTRNVDLVEENLFGGGSCPADVYFAPHGLQSLKVWDWNQSCGYITGYVKPILLLCCTFSAFMILVPGRTE